MKCGTDAALKSIQDIFMTDLQHCFIVKNTGETFLKSITLSNGQLQYEKSISSPLPPGDTIQFSVPSKLVSTVENTLDATGIPCWEQGSSGPCYTIPDLAPSVAKDSANVEKLVFDVGVQIENSVKLGSHETKCTGLEFVEDKPGSVIRVASVVETHFSVGFRCRCDVLLRR